VEAREVVNEDARGTSGVLASPSDARARHVAWHCGADGAVLPCFRICVWLGRTVRCVSNVRGDDAAGVDRRQPFLRVVGISDNLNSSRHKNASRLLQKILST
jgi:hypothetical protein